MPRRIVYLMLLFGIISNAQEKYCVDRDSLFSVFSNYRELQIEASGLRVDTSIYQGVYREQSALILNLETEITNYRDFIIPNYLKVEEAQSEQIDNLNDQIKKEKTTKWLTIGGAGVLTLLSLLL